MTERKNCECGPILLIDITRNSTRARDSLIFAGLKNIERTGPVQPCSEFLCGCIFGFIAIMVVSRMFILVMVTVVRGGQETEESLSMHTGTQIMLDSIPNRDYDENFKDVFLGGSLNLLQDVLMKVSDSAVDNSPGQIAVKRSDTEFECNEIDCDDEKTPVMGITGNDEIKHDGVSGEDPVVTTRLGRVRGLTLDKAHVFYGIPYADPPVGVKRWDYPSPPSPWTYTYDATFPRPACMQVCAGESCPSKVFYHLQNVFFLIIHQSKCKRMLETKLSVERQKHERQRHEIS